MPKQKLKKLPIFKNENEEREFWWNNSPLDYFDQEKAFVALFPNMRTSTKSVTVRLPIELIGDLKMMAKKRDVPYQSLMKTLLYQSVKEEIAKYTT